MGFGMGMGMGMGGGGGRWAGPMKPQDFWGSVKRCIPWAKPFWPILLFGVIFSVAGTFLGQQPPRIMQYTIDEIIRPGHYAKLTHVVLIYLLILFLGQLVGALSRYWMSLAGQRLLNSLRLAVYDHFQLLSIGYYDNKRTGDLMSRVTGDVQQLENLIINTPNSLVNQIFGMGFALFFMFHYNATLTLLVMIPVPILAVSVWIFTRRIRLVYRAIRDRVGEMSAKLQENLSGMRVIKAFHREPIEHEMIAEVSGNLMQMTMKATLATSIFYPSISFVRSIGTVIVLGFGASLISRDLFTIGALTAFLMYVGHFYQPIDEFIRLFDMIQRSLAAGERIFEVLDTKPEITDPANPVPLDSVRGEVAFHDVSFRYATGEEVLRNVSLQAASGQRIALVGQSGAGKSSFINLIPRFYDVVDGCVTVDGVDVRAVKQADLRKHISLVLQETFLFNGSVRENLRFGRLNAADADVEAAAQVANAHEFIERLPNGYDTQIGERGIKLSGGQKQRLAIARAVLADPRILILDEATSSVDSESEYLIHQALERLMVGRTTFVIAHRLSTIRNADVILVLENGEIIERGNHAALLTADQRYAQMYRQQFWLDDLAEAELATLDPEQPDEDAVLPQPDEVG